MKKYLYFILCVAPLLMFAQNGPNGEYWQLNRWEAKEGMVEKFQEAVSKKTKKFNNTTETAILTFRIVTGPDSGKFMRVIGPKSSDFFDNSTNSEEYAYWEKNVMPFVKNQSGNNRTRRFESLSYNWNNSEAPKKYVKFTTVRLNPGEGNEWWNRVSNDAKLKKLHGFSGIRGVFWSVSGGQREIHVVEPYDSHAESMGEFENKDFDYRDSYNEMFGWRSLSWDDMKSGTSVRDYAGEIVETLEFIPEMSTSME
tara:strand:- start:366 stop:1127 length:762 start_codon:yes stop_codon:yes gene_type:complete